MKKEGILRKVNNMSKRRFITSGEQYDKRKYITSSE